MGVDPLVEAVVDAELAATGGESLAAGDDGAGGDACATSPGLVLHTALVGAHHEPSVRQGLDEVDVGALGTELRQVADASPLPCHIVMREVVDPLDIMRHTGVEEPSVQAALHTAVGYVLHPQVDDACGRCVVPRQHHGIVGAVIGQETERGSLVGASRQSQTMGESGDTAATVSAHVGGKAVGIVVAHDEVVALTWCAEHQQSVGTHAAATMAQALNLSGSEGEGSSTVVDDDKIVAGTVVFAKRDCHWVGYWAARCCGQARPTP